MTGVIPETYGSTGPWQRYVAKEHAAREAYLLVTHRAQQEYLTGPYPDREAYETVERSAWITYYAAGRDAWRRYTAEISPPPPPPAHGAAPYLTRDSGGEVWPSDQRFPDHPSFTERNGGTQ